jgi:serine/threonine protein kinase
MDQQIAGTSLYLAPEQLQGHPLPASDQYSLAVVVYEWLCGKSPFRGSLLEIAVQHLSLPPPPLRDRIPDLSSAIEEVVLQALAKEPGQRFADVQEFARALERAYLQGLQQFSALHNSAPPDITQLSSLEKAEVSST